MIIQCPSGSMVISLSWMWYLEHRPWHSRVLNQDFFSYGSNVIFFELNADSVVILVQLAPSGVFQPQETLLEHLMPFFYISHFKIVILHLTHQLFETARTLPSPNICAKFLSIFLLVAFHICTHQLFKTARTLPTPAEVISNSWASAFSHWTLNSNVTYLSKRCWNYESQSLENFIWPCAKLNADPNLRLKNIGMKING